VLPRIQRVDAVDWQPVTHARRETHEGADLLVASWDAGQTPKRLTVRMQVATRERPSPWLSSNGTATLSSSERAKYLRATRWIPTSGIVRDKALDIVRAHATPLTKARAIYDWIVENTFRDPTVRGCGTGDIRWMLESGSLGGKCADLNALFVGLCRAVALPARDLYGIRVAPSREFKSLGRAGDITTAQHCRAEVFVDDIGWIAVDPADVRKVVLEEQPGGTLAGSHARRARERLFGTWEMNWVAFNDAHDVTLPASKGRILPFFMYPHAEIGGTRRDSLDPERFRYHITSREVA
jgi:transglutaminase-like putative cysteine protease